MKNSLKNKKDLGKKILNNSFGTNTKTKINGESQNLIKENKNDDKDKDKKHKSLKSSSEEEEEEDNINMAGLGYFMPYKNNVKRRKQFESDESKSSKSSENSKTLEKIDFLQKNENENRDSIKDDININNVQEKSKSIIQQKFNNNEINLPLNKPKENTSNLNNSEENKNIEDNSKNPNFSDDNTRNIVNIYIKPKPQNFNDIENRAEEDNNSNNNIKENNEEEENND
jgi:hypothetical protein